MPTCFLGATTSVGGTILLDPESYINQSATTDTSQAAVPVDAPDTAAWAMGTFTGYLSSSVQALLTAQCRLKWGVTAPCAGAAARGRVRVDLIANGDTVGTGYGAARALNAADDFIEIISIAASTQGAYQPGSQIAVELTMEITVASATPADTADMVLYHDPQTTDDQLVADFGGIRIDQGV